MAPRGEAIAVASSPPLHRPVLTAETLRALDPRPDELLLDPPPKLAPADRTWLEERCRKWATAIDGHLAALESGQDVLAVRTAADATINKLADALAARPTQPIT